MEAIGETSFHTAPEAVKVNVGDDEIAAVSMESELGPKSNGVGNAVDVYLGAGAAAGRALFDNSGVDAQTADAQATKEAKVEPPSAPEDMVLAPPEAEVMAALETSAAVQHLLGDTSMQKPLEEITEGIILDSANYISSQNEAVVEESVVEEGVEYQQPNEQVTFQTEVLVEKNDNEGNGDMNYTAMGQNANNILNEIGHNIELSEVLRSSDATDGAEHSNGAKQEVFNKEELLDILEGNNESMDEINIKDDTSRINLKSSLEAEIALNQLTRLRNSRKKKQKNSNTKAEKTPRRSRKTDKKSLNSSENADTTSENCNAEEYNDSAEAGTKEAESNQKPQNDSIVNVLVKDWDDDEPSELDESNNLPKDGETSVNTSEVNTNEQLTQEVVTKKEESSNLSTTESAAVDNQTDSKKVGEEDQPQKRQGRVIKKKVPFDPDNPDTFTKGKNLSKSKERETTTTEKEQLPKKPKVERPKSKSPVAKMAWKKPQPKNNSKQNKRLTEIDRLLMDEGAVNMIYQLTPEAPKGKKNMRTKAEFIKKLQSSTPDGTQKEMKFRERKAIKGEDEAKKILGGKRTSLSSSVKSPMCEDFETHSADDSIIYRRHSSSSYSSSCMSPRRLSDVETGAAQGAARASRQSSEVQKQTAQSVAADPVTDIFMADDITNNEINKDDCLSIKEKLNTKLSQVLKKRKRETSKVEKPTKQKRLSKEIKNEKSGTESSTLDFKYLSVSFDQRMAEICIKKTGSKSSTEMLTELEKALQLIDNRKDISVTLLSSECGTLCPEINLLPLIDDNMERRTNNAYEIAESVRLVICALEAHSKLCVAGVWGACAGVALALAARADVLLASERATFAVASAAHMIGVAALSAKCSGLPDSLVNDMVIFERCLSASEARAGGLVTRTLWPERAQEEARAIALDIAAQPAQSVLLKKQLLKLRKCKGEATFLAALEKERDLLVQYWTSVEGQELLRATLSDTHT